MKTLTIQHPLKNPKEAFTWLRKEGEKVGLTVTSELLTRGLLPYFSFHILLPEATTHPADECEKENCTDCHEYHECWKIINELVDRYQERF